MLVSSDQLVEAAVAETIDALTLAPEDAAATRLARRYAAAIDAAEDPQEAMEKLGPKLLAVLEALGATPRSRAASKPATPAARLEALRAARRS